MGRKRMIRTLGLAAVGAVLAGGLGAWSVQPVVAPAWTYGELRVALSGIHLRFVQAEDTDILKPPQEVRRSSTRSKLYYLDRLTGAGWELLEVDQTEQDWVYLMRRPNRGP